jgi:hypothetical protein
MKQQPPDEKTVKRMQKGMEACLKDIEQVPLSYLTETLFRFNYRGKEMMRLRY